MNGRCNKWLILDDWTNKGKVQQEEDYDRNEYYYGFSKKQITESSCVKLRQVVKMERTVVGVASVVVVVGVVVIVVSSGK